MSVSEPPERDYPPAAHILRDLQLEMETGPDDHFLARMPVVPEVLASNGCVEAAVLATLADVAGATVTFQFLLPDWMATADLSVQVLDTPQGETLIARATILRAGRKTVLTEVEIRDDAPEPTLVGHAVLSFARIERPERTRDLQPADTQDSALRTPFGRAANQMSLTHREQTGVVIENAARGVCTLARSDYTANSFGTLQGGSIATLAESAAESLLESLGETALSTDMNVRYLAQGPRGPYRTEARLLRRSVQEALVRVEIHDTGNEALMSIAYVDLQMS